MKLRHLSLPTILSLALLAMLIAAAWQFTQERRSDILAEYRLDAARELHEIQNILENKVSRFFAISQALRAFTSLNPDFDEAEFEAFTGALDTPEGLVSIQLQPDGVVRHLTNPEANPGVIGYDLFADPRLGPLTADIAEKRQPRLVGPIELIQGGQGFVATVPIYIEGFEGRYGYRDFWGFASTVFSAQILLDKVTEHQIEHPGSPAIYALRTIRGDGQPGTLVFGEDSTFERALETTPITLAYDRLELSVALKPQFSASGFPLLPQELRPAFWLMVTLSVLLSGGVWYVITAQRRSEALAADHAAERAANKLKSDFIATVSHEMRTPLNGVLGAMELLQLTSLTQEQKHLLRVGQSSSRLLLRHVNSVLDIEKLERGPAMAETSLLDLTELVGEVVDLISPRAALNDTVVEHEIELSENRLLGDQDMLSQVVTNFAANAAKFTRNGRITISVQTIASDGVRDTVEFRVSDTGVGISPRNLERVFDDFVTVEETYDLEVTGSGLGLAICRRIASALGGDVGAESALGEGSSFWMRVPLQIAKDGEAAGTEEPGNNDALTGALLGLDLRASLDILLVDDNQTNLLVESGLLRAAGHRITEAIDGREAVEIARRRKFDLILMDINMPHIDGIQATQVIREKAGPNQKTPIVAVTAHAMPAERRRFLQAGMQACMIKPFRIRDFEELLETARRDTPQGAQPAGAGEKSEIPDDIDWSVIKTLEEMLGPQQLTPTLVKICAEIEREVSMIADRNNRSAGEIAERAHKLAGTTATAGAVRLTSALRLVETAAKYGDESGLSSALEAVQVTAFVACVAIRSRYKLPPAH